MPPYFISTHILYTSRYKQSQLYIMFIHVCVCLFVDMMAWRAVMIMTTTTRMVMKKKTKEQTKRRIYTRCDFNVMENFCGCVQNYVEEAEKKGKVYQRFMFQYFKEKFCGVRLLYLQAV